MNSPKVFHEGKIIYQLPNLGESEKIDPASRLATRGQVIEIHKTYCKYNAILWELSMRKSKFIFIKGFYTNLSDSNIEIFCLIILIDF